MPVPEVTEAVVWLLVINALSVVVVVIPRISVIGEQVAAPLVKAGPLVAVPAMVPVVIAIWYRVGRPLPLELSPQTYRLPVGLAGLTLVKYVLSNVPS